MSGDFDAARASVQRSAEIERELGREFYATHFVTQVEAEIERLASAFERQARVLRDGLARWEAAFGETNAMLAAMLALALAESELDEEAAEYVELAKQASWGHGPHVEPLWRRANAYVLAPRQGRFDEADRSAMDAFNILSSTEFTEQIGDALLTLARVRHAAGEDEGAFKAAREALDRYQRKGVVPSISAAAALVGELRPEVLDGVSPSKAVLRNTLRNNSVARQGRPTHSCDMRNTCSGL